MPIDPRMVAWDSAPTVDPRMVAWDDEPTKKPKLTPRELLSASLAPAMNYDGTDATAGAIRGAGSIGASLMRLLPNALGGDTGPENEQRRKSMDAGLQELLGANPDSSAYKTNKLLAEIGGTAGAGGVLARGASMIPGATRFAAPFIDALQSSGMSAGGATGLGGLAARTAGGAASGGAMAGMVDPREAGVGAVVGGAFPMATKALGETGSLLGGLFRGKGVSPEVQALAEKAKNYGVDIPADRLVDSKPLNAIASGLNYVPFSGRAGTEARMNSQLNQALSRTFGQDSSNVTMALRKADDALGGQFESTLKRTNVSYNQKSLQDLAGVFDTAQKELGGDALKPIVAQVNDLLKKGFGDLYKPAIHGHGGPSADEVFGQLQKLIDSGAMGAVDGQAAYNIKRALDRIGRSNTPTAYHAIELKRSLMDALNNSLGDDAAKAFAVTRQQYGNMLALEKLAKNGAEGELSVARIANMKNINNEPLQDIADIAAQFVKPREGQHGAMQRAFAALGVGSFAGLPALGGTVAAGRVANTALNSQGMKNFLLNQPSQGLLGNTIDEMLPYMYRTNPVLSGGLISGQ